MAVVRRVQPAGMGVYSEHLRPRLHTLALKDKLTGEVRHRVCAQLSGDVLEIGIGSALNQPHLPPTVTGVWAVEPSATAIRLGAERRAASAIPVVVAGDDAQSLPFPDVIPVVVAGDDAQSLPFPDDGFDAALCTWVLCGIPDPGRALAEIARVLRPGGSLHFVEHGLASEPGTVTWQRRGNRINRAIAGCVLDNDVASLLTASPLTVTRMTTYYERGAPKPAGYMYEGSAVV